jgi:hypothetical protein
MDDLVVVFRAAGLSEAEIIKGFLESAEIPVHLSYESAGAVYGLTVDGLGEVRVKVPAGFAPLALELLEEQLKGSPDHAGILCLRARRPAGDDPDVA